MMLAQLALLCLAVSQTSQVAQPKGFTDDPYVDDEKFIEKGGPALSLYLTSSILVLSLRCD